MSMNSIPLDNIKPHFSGHETFPLRHAWIPKALPLVEKQRDILFNLEELMITMGIGKNMAKSVRHWLEATSLVNPPTDNGHDLSEIGRIILSDDGDMYLEKSMSIWLLHFLLTSNFTKATSWYFLFNVYPNRTFTKERLQEAVIAWCRELDLPVPSANTLKRDIQALVGMYSSSAQTREKDLQAILASPMRELNLLTDHYEDGSIVYSFRHVAPGEISEDVFSFSLLYYLESIGLPESISFAEILEAYGSPARIFRFSENLLAKYLLSFGRRSDHPYKYNTTAGTKQLLKSRFEGFSIESFLASIYEGN